MEIPPRFKPVTQYIRRAEKLDRAAEPEAPIVAYYCRLYAADQAIKLQDSSEKSKAFLSAMITRLEEDKKRGLTNFTEEESKKMCTDWALKEFNAADEEDRAGFADQSTARAFYAAGVFFEILRQFGPTDEDTDKRRLYCKWKAAQILKALKEGRSPTPGGVGEEAPPEPARSEEPSSQAEEKKTGGGLDSVVPEAPSHMPSPYVPPTTTSLDTTEDPVKAPVGSTQLSSLPTVDSGGGGSLYPTGESGPPPSSMYVAPNPPRDSVPASEPFSNPNSTPSVAPAPAPYVAPAPAPYVAPAPAPYVAPAPAPYVAPAPAPYVAPAPAPYVAPAPAPYVAPAPGPSIPWGGSGDEEYGHEIVGPITSCNLAIKALESKEIEVAAQEMHKALDLSPPPRPFVQLGHAGERKTSGDNVKDAIEFTFFAIRAFEMKEYALAKEKLEGGLKHIE